MNIAVMDFVEVARLRGEGLMWIIRREILPNSMSPLVAEFGLRFCFVFLFISALSFLGLGITPPIPSWGNMLTDAQSYFRDNFMLAVYPGILILVAVVCFNFIGDGLRDALDPKQFMKSK